VYVAGVLFVIANCNANGKLSQGHKRYTRHIFPLQRKKSSELRTRSSFLTCCDLAEMANHGIWRFWPFWFPTLLDFPAPAIQTSGYDVQKSQYSDD